MKKILFLLAALVMNVSAWAQTTPELTTDVNNPKYYTISSYNRGGVLTSNGAGQGTTHVGATADRGLWYFTAAPNNEANTVAGGVIMHSADELQLKSNWQTAETGDVLYILPNGVNQEGFSISNNATISGSCCLDANNNNTGVGSWAPSNSDWQGTTWVFAEAKYVTLLNKQHNVYLGVNAAATQLSSTKEKTDNNVWQLIKEGSKYKLYNPESYSYAGKIQSRNAAVVVCSTAADAGLCEIAKNSTDYYTLKCTNGANTGYSYYHQVDWGGYAVVDWNATSDASMWTIEDAQYTPTQKVEIVYDYYFEGSKVGSETQRVAPGQSYPDPLRTFAGYAIGAKPTGTVDESCTKDITLTWNGPFTPTTIESGAFAENTNWYYMENGNNKGNGYVVYDANSKKSNFVVIPSANDEYLWTFVRKPGTTYFYLYNKKVGAAGAMKELLSSNQDYASNHNQGYVASEGANDMPLELIANSNGYTLKLADAPGTCILGHHVQDGSTWRLSIWGPSANVTDNGSRFVFTKYEAPVPVVDTNKFYRLKSKLFGTERNTNGETHTIGYMDAVELTKGNRTFAFNGYGAADASFGEVFQFVPDGNVYYLYAQGAYMNKLVDGSVGCTTNQADAALFNLAKTTEDGYYYLIDTKQSNNNWKYAQLSDWWGFGIGGWNTGTAGSDDDLRCQWQFEEVESVTVSLTKIGDHSYATLYAPYAVSLPDGVVAFTATRENDYLTMSEMNGTIPAGTAVVLYSEEGDESAELTLQAADAASENQNELSGTYRSASAGADKFVFSSVEGMLGFYKFAGSSLAANKAYYVPTTTEVQGFVLNFGGEGTTGIQSLIESAKTNGISFDLAGRRVNANVKGISIQNNKKVIR